MTWDLPPLYDEPSITADGRTVHAVDAQRTLAARDAATGAVRWVADPPPIGRWTREESYGDGVVALFGADRSTGICRFDGAGKRRWCAKLSGPAADLHVGSTGTGVWVEDDGCAATILDPETGAQVGQRIPGGEIHLYYDVSQPHDTRFVPSAAVIGVIGGVNVVVNGQDGTVTGYRGQDRQWTHALTDRSALSMGAFGGSLVFGLWTAPSVASSGLVFQVGTELLGLAPDGRLAWWRTAPAGRLVDVGQPVLVTDADVRAIDPSSGAERWRTAVDGFGAVVGERGDVAYVEAGSGPRDVVWVDPKSGKVRARTPLSGRTGSITATAGGLLAITGAGDQARWSMLGPDGAERWSVAGSFTALDGVGLRYDTSELVDLGTGQVRGPSPGYRVASGGGTWIVYDQGSYAVVAAPAP